MIAAAAPGQHDRARSALKELDQQPDLWSTPALAAMVSRARAEAALCEALSAEAITSLRRALQIWQALCAPLNAAGVRLRLAQLLVLEGETEAAELELSAAGSAFRMAGATAALPALQGLNVLSANGRVSAPRGKGGYGPLVPAADLRDGVERISLPEGFEYRSFSAAGELMSDGNRVPLAHDGSNQTGNLTFCSVTPPVPSLTFLERSSIRSARSGRPTRRRPRARYQLTLSHVVPRKTSEPGCQVGQKVGSSTATVTKP